MKLLDSTPSDQRFLFKVVQSNWDKRSSLQIYLPLTERSGAAVVALDNFFIYITYPAAQILRLQRAFAKLEECFRGNAHDLKVALFFAGIGGAKEEPRDMATH